MTGPAIKTKEPLRRFRRNDERSDDAAPWEGKRVATVALPNWSFWEGMVKCSGCSLISVAACVHTLSSPSSWQVTHFLLGFCHLDWTTYWCWCRKDPSDPTDEGPGPSASQKQAAIWPSAWILFVSLETPICLYIIYYTSALAPPPLLHHTLNIRFDILTYDFPILMFSFCQVQIILA